MVGGMALSVRDKQGIKARYSEYEQIAARAVEVFGNEREAVRWLSSASRDFEGRTPLHDFIDQGPDRVLGVLGRIEHGVSF